MSNVRVLIEEAERNLTIGRDAEILLVQLWGAVLRHTEDPNNSINMDGVDVFSIMEMTGMRPNVQIPNLNDLITK